MLSKFSTVFLLSQAPILAQATQANLYLPYGKEIPVSASVIAVNAAATTYGLGCANANPTQKSGTGPFGREPCGSLASLTVTQGPSTLAFASSTNVAPSGSPPTFVKAFLNCDLAGTISAVCTASYSGIEKIQPRTGLSPQDLAIFSASIEDYKTTAVDTIMATDRPVIGPVSVTAGAEKLSTYGGGKQQVVEVTVTEEITGYATTQAAASLATGVVTNPAGGGVNTSVSKTSSSVAYVTPTGNANANANATANRNASASAKATTTAKAGGPSSSATGGLIAVLGFALVAFIGL